ncbi:MAG TPA: ABC transporter substrate-binding protein [Pseudonocardiaceae bacterium]|nr:ABC transporter substrate-binding protein [Pseudonocardiaceae bacterium]
MATVTLDARSDVITGLTRRRFLGGVSLVAVLAAYGGESGPNPSTTGDAVEGSGFPVTVDHKYGSTTIPARPQRVVTVGFTDPDFVLALGVEPVAITDWYGDYPLGIWPWAQDALGDAKPGVMPRPQGDKLNFELIAGFRPDLIIGQYTGMTQEEYERASRLAPTVAQSGEHQDYTAPWQVTTRTVGKALGRPAQAEQLITGVESRFASVRREHPEFVGAPLIVTERLEVSTVYIRTEEPQNGLFREPGFTQPEPIAELLVDEDGYSGNLSDERMELLDTASVVVWKLFDQASVPEELANHPHISESEGSAGGARPVLTDKVLVGALAFGSVLSMPYALDRIVPMLAATLDGDPATVPVS